MSSECRRAFRVIRKNRGSSVVAVLTLTVAIGGATTIYGVVDLFWHFLPAQQTDRLVFVASTDLRPGQSQAFNNGVARVGVSVPDLIDLAARTQTIEQFAGFTLDTATLTNVPAPERLATLRATGNLPSVWGMTATVGRLFTPDDGRPGAPRVALLSNAFWQRRFNGSSSMLGSSLVLDGEPHTIIGVLPGALSRGLFAGVDVMTPLALDPGRARDDRRVFLSGLLRPGVSRDQARADLERIARQLQVEHPQTNSRIGIVVRPLMEMLGAETPTLIALLVILAMLLVALACANVTNVMLSAAVARQREFSMRRALGARRGDLIAPLIIEGLVLSVVAAAGGVLLAWAAIGAIQVLEPAAQSFGAVSMNPRVVLAAIAMAMGAALGFSLVPALRAARVPTDGLNRGLADGSERASARLLPKVFVGAQVALAVVLVSQIAAIGGSAWSYRTRELGFDDQRLLTFKVELASRRYADPVAIGQFVAQALPRIEAVPGVASVAVINRLPIADGELAAHMRLEGTAPRREDLPDISLSKVTERYFETMQIPIVRGRGLAAEDLALRRPVALISQAAARRYWPSRDPLGTHITLDVGGVEPDWLEIVGVVGDVRNSNVDSPPPLQVYVPLSRAPEKALAFAVRSAGTDPAQLTTAIRSAMAAVDNEEPAFAIRTMERVVADDLSGVMLITSVLLAVAVISIALAAAGIYGVTSYAVVRRTREIGIRTAIGASGAAVVRLVVAQIATPVACGAALGIAAALPLGAIASGAMPDIEFANPITYGGVVAGLVAVAAGAALSPARRAVRVDPMIALKSE